MNLARLDLNLLVALDALLRHRNVTRAAAEMGLSQPALSASLARLRRHFGDDLLTRVGNDYQLTPLAAQLESLVRVAVAGAEKVFAAPAAFVPASSTREFSLLISDYAVSVLGDTVAAILADEAPGVRLRLAGNHPGAVDRADKSLLTTDLLVMPHGFVTELSHADLYQDEWVCLVSAGAPAVHRGGLNLDDLRELPWVVTYHSPTASTPAARQMRMLGVEPRVQIVTESFLTVPPLVAGTNRVALLQRRLVDLLPLNAGVRALPCPFEVAPLIEAMWWHPAYDNDAEHLYLRDVVLRAAHRATTPPAGT
ncbi:LysR family transcriptional regulator [Kineosporia sp. NBRC 101731]|uniref:LysR family transcriptional regulator n=1 Tax=Kineosporia sp. NBRC 101731 TaxID=3032199 RepID=UPI0024A08B56|nr:LysR family transcriptional regulator [Kineosporia sp. NBRC 101731]GLY29740.1 LysR family transcriptional regulator [Kineosporia sp. NBRC 101731]